MELLMVRFAIRIFVMPVTIALIDAVILIPIGPSIYHVVEELLKGKLDEPMEVLEGVGVVMIGWGVAIEERSSLREIFHLEGVGDETLQAGIDTLCHASGIGLLILGLFSEIAVTAVRLPNHIVPTEGFDGPVLGVSLFFIVLGVYVIVQHIVRLLIAMIWRRVPAPYHSR